MLDRLKKRCHITNKLLTSLAQDRTGEHWRSVVFVRTLLHSVRTATTSGQYSPVSYSRSVSKRLILDALGIEPFGFAAHKLPFDSQFCRYPVLHSQATLLVYFIPTVCFCRAFIVGRVTESSNSIPTHFCYYGGGSHEFPEISSTTIYSLMVNFNR